VPTGFASPPIPPANTTFLVGNLIGDFRVEIEAEAVVSRKRD
jgi:enamine deaminase RidA (YjgF/YER057c/UK114 family)